MPGVAIQNTGDTEGGLIMSVPGPSDVERLCRLGGACVSIYLGPHQKGAGTKPARVRLRPLLLEADQLLEDRAVSDTDRAALLAPLNELLDRAEFSAGGEGIALFRSPQACEMFRIPWPSADSVNVEGRFFVRPLVEHLTERSRFLLLALSRKHLRLLECSPAGFAELVLPPGVPSGVDEFEGFDAPDHALMGSTSPGPSSGKGGVYFGTSTYRDKQYHYLHDFFRAVDRGLHALLMERGVPLVLAGTESEVATYRAANTYAALLDEAVFTSPDGGWTDHELISRAREAMESWVGAEHKRAAELFRRLVGSTRACCEVEATARAAAQGRVHHLFLTTASPQMGDIDRLTSRLLMSGEFRSSHDDLVNAAAVETLRHGGHVWFVAPDRMPEPATIAAVLRY